MPIKLTTTTGGERGKRKKKKNVQKNLQNKSKHKNNKCFSWVTAVRVLSLAGNHSPPYLPRIHSNTVISGPAVGAAQILICSYFSVFLPPMSTAIRTSVFSFVGALNDLVYIPQTQSLPSWSCGFNLQLIQLVGRFWVFFLSHTAPWFQLWFYSHLCMWLFHWGLLLRLPWRTWVCPSEGQVWRWCSCLGHRGSGSTRHSGKLAARAAGNIVL